MIRWLVHQGSLARDPSRSSDPKQQRNRCNLGPNQKCGLRGNCPHGSRRRHAGTWLSLLLCASSRLAFRLLQSIVLTAPSLVPWTGSKTGQMTQPATCIVFCITGGLWAPKQ
jgi:hypothetical protein